MARTHRIISQIKKEAFISALLSGLSMSDACKKAKISSPTGRDWARSEEVRQKIKEGTSQFRQMAIDHLKANCLPAAEEITRLFRQSDSDSVRLSAARSVFSDHITLEQFNELSANVKKILRHMEKQNSSGNRR